MTNDGFDIIKSVLSAIRSFNIFYYVRSFTVAIFVQNALLHIIDLLTVIADWTDSGRPW